MANNDKTATPTDLSGDAVEEIRATCVDCLQTSSRFT